MAYSELIKSFDKIRSYMRDFYVYGFKTRMEFDQKSSRSYDDERRRVESWLGEYMYFEQDADGKRVFLSVDSETVSYNPLYRAFKTSSFTDNDITLHFYIMDMLAGGEKLSGREILDELSEYLSCFDTPMELDESTIRKKLKEYEKTGLLKSEKQGREVFWSRSKDVVDQEAWRDAVAFYSEADPLGVVGSFLLDKPGREAVSLSFKNHYLLCALDMEVLLEIMTAIREHRYVEIIPFSKQEEINAIILPLRVYISTQNGRQYVLGWHQGKDCLQTFRLDSIRAVRQLDVEKNTERYFRDYEVSRNKIWGVSLGDRDHTDHLTMVIYAGRGEDYIIRRLEREKRCASLERLDDYRWRLTAEVFDAKEMIPWIRTFIGRIQSLQCSNPEIEEIFRKDLEAMWDNYGR